VNWEVIDWDKVEDALKRLGGVALLPVELVRKIAKAIGDVPALLLTGYVVHRALKRPRKRLR
jgi:hypothetical protein